MKKIVFFFMLCLPLWALAQNETDSTIIYKKRVLETTDLEILTSYYNQEGQNAAVTGGIGTEELDNFANYINVSIPIKDDGVFSINGTISAYTSASSSNLDPWSGASGGDDDYDDDYGGNIEGGNFGTPWAASSGASRQDVWTNLNIGYSHSSDDRNTMYSINLSGANEYDYTSIGSSIGLVKLFNQKNTEFSLNGTVYLDAWSPQYPTEITTYLNNNGNLNADFFEGTDILDQNGNFIDKISSDAWKPLNNRLIDDKSRNSYALSLGFSQILSKTTQVSILIDFTYQTGWLGNPMQRVYFADKDNFYIGNAASIPFYTDPKNKDVFQLADDIERLPDRRFKIPVGVRLNQYLNEFLVFRSYYRYYFDDWGIQSHTLDAEIAIKVGQKFTLYPNYRFYNQTAADYFAPYEQLISASQYYTSDFDLSEYNVNQFGLGIKYTDVFSRSHLWKFGLKELTLDYNYYERNTGLNAQIVSFGAIFIIDFPGLQ